MIKTNISMSCYKTYNENKFKQISQTDNNLILSIKKFGKFRNIRENPVKDPDRGPYTENRK